MPLSILNCNIPKLADKQTYFESHNHQKMFYQENIFGYVTTSTIYFESQNKILLVMSWTKIMT